MKKLLFLSLLLGALPYTGQAQDDMYFVPSKKAKKAQVQYVTPTDYSYSGSDRDVDEYNRQGSYYEYMGNDSSDVIHFSGERGVYPDSTADFALTQRMSRWEGYTPNEAYWEGYTQGRSDELSISSWHSPWYYSSFYPWYDTWYDPWYYGGWSWHYSWYDPWYYRNYRYYYGWGWGGYYHSWYAPRYYHRGSYAYNSHHYYPGSRRSAGRALGNGRSSAYASGVTSRRNASSGTFGGTRSVGRTGNYAPARSAASSSTRTSTLSRSATSAPITRSSSSSSSSVGSFGSRSSSSSSSSGGSFGSRSSGGGGGGSFGSRSSGGGGGGRSGGGTFGGRR